MTTAHSSPNNLFNLIKIDPILKCSLVNRDNRFVVNVEFNGKIYKAHTNNTGRMLEFMNKGQVVYCTSKPKGKTDFRLFAFEDNSVDGDVAALVDTRYQMQSFEVAWQRGLISWLNGWQMKSRDSDLYGSKIDYLAIPSGEIKQKYYSQFTISHPNMKIIAQNSCPAYPSDENDKLYIEIKSAAERGINQMTNFAMYPDCPSLRGQKHIKHLTQYKNENGNSAIVFMCAIPKIDAFTPNALKDPQMMPLIKEAVDCGVCFRAINIYFDSKSGYIKLANPDIPVMV